MKWNQCGHVVEAERKKEKGRESEIKRQISLCVSGLICLHVHTVLFYL